MKQKRKITAIITAAGSGTRFSSSGMPKQFVKLNGEPVIYFSMIAFQKCRDIKEIIVSSDKKYFNLIHGLAEKTGITKLTKLVEGGKTRFESVRNAFFQAESGPDDLIMIHDAVRPNIDSKFIIKLFKEAANKGEVIPGIRIPDTVKKAIKGVIRKSLNRENLWAIQTPQVFRYKLLRKAYSACRKKNDFTDESSLLEYAGFKVNIIEGKWGNLKITTQDDFKLLRFLVK